MYQLAHGEQCTTRSPASLLSSPFCVGVARSLGAFSCRCFSFCASFWAVLFNAGLRLRHYSHWTSATPVDVMPAGGAKKRCVSPLWCREWTPFLLMFRSDGVHVGSLPFLGRPTWFANVGLLVCCEERTPDEMLYGQAWRRALSLFGERERETHPDDENFTSKPKRMHKNDFTARQKRRSFRGRVWPQRGVATKIGIVREVHLYSPCAGRPYHEVSLDGMVIFGTSHPRNVTRCS